MIRRVLPACLLSVALAAQARPAHLFVFATDATGRPVIDLSQADLDVKENGATARVLAFRRGTDPMRVVLISNIHDSTDVGALKRGLKQLVSALPDGVEITALTAAGACNSRMAPTTDRARQLAAADSLADGGGRLAETLMACEGTLFRNQPERWPVYVIVTDDTTEDTSGLKQIEFDAFSERMSRSATIHAVLSKEGGNSQTGKIVDALAKNLPSNTHGFYQEVSAGRGLAEAIGAAGARIAADARRMADGYELSYESSASAAGSGLEIGTVRPGVVLRPSLLRVP